MDPVKDIIKDIVELPNLPAFSAGDTISVSYKIKEGSKERIQQFQGVVLQKRGSVLPKHLLLEKCLEISA